MEHYIEQYSKLIESFKNLPEDVQDKILEYLSKRVLRILSESAARKGKK